jgi:hypothetical protein
MAFRLRESLVRGNLPGAHRLPTLPGQPQSVTAPAQIQVVLNWFEDVKQRVPVR